MTWEETIEYIRTNPEYKELVEKAYFEQNLSLNVERFRHGEEFIETVAIIKRRCLEANTIADIGSGNGIASIAFALEGYKVFSIEPDPSIVIGAGAIRKLTDEYHLNGKVIVSTCFGEETGLQDRQVDVVYIRQAMHHANDLKQMMRECYRILRPGGLLLTIRDHVIFDEADKKWFLESHPLHKFYGGENAYTAGEYRHAMINAGFTIETMLKYYDSVVNYFPMTKGDVANMLENKNKLLLEKLAKRIGMVGRIKLIRNLYLSFRKPDPASV